MTFKSLFYYFRLSHLPTNALLPGYLVATDSTISEEIMLTVAILGDKCATDYMFYVDVMVNLIILAVDYVSKEDWQRVMKNINRYDVQVMISPKKYIFYH